MVVFQMVKTWYRLCKVQKKKNSDYLPTNGRELRQGGPAVVVPRVVERGLHPELLLDLLLATCARPSCMLHHYSKITGSRSSPVCQRPLPLNWNGDSSVLYPKRIVTNCT